MRTTKKSRLNLCAKHVVGREAVENEGASSTPVQKPSSEVDACTQFQTSNPSSPRDPQSFVTDPDSFLRTLNDAKKSGDIQQLLTWDPRVPISASAPDINGSEQNQKNCTEQPATGAATVVAARRSATPSPDVLAGRNTFLFSPYVPRSLVTVHLMPCRFAFTGPAPVRKYFRPWRVPVPLHAPVREIWRNTHTFAESLRHHDGKKVPATSASPAYSDKEEKHSRLKPKVKKDMNNGVSRLVHSEGSSCQSNPADQAFQPQADELVSQEKANTRRKLDYTSRSGCCECTVDIRNGHAEGTPPQLYEALLHGRLLRGIALPLEQCRLPLDNDDSEEYQAGLDTNASFPLTEGLQGYLIMRRSVSGGQVDGEAGVTTAACTTESTQTGSKPAQQKSLARSAWVPEGAHAATEQKQDYKCVAEFVPVARINRLCYWNHDALPTPLDDVPQALAFMQLARIVHSMTDD